MTYKLALWLSWVAFAAGIAGFAMAQLYAPNQIDGCVVSTNATPGYTQGERVALTCNAAGQLRTTTTP